MSLLFSANDAQVLTAGSQTINGQLMTICFWSRVKVSAAGVLLYLTDGIGNTVDFETNGSTGLEIDVNSTTFKNLYTNGLNTWRYIAMTIQGSTPWTITGYASPANGGPLVVTSGTSALPPASFVTLNIGDISGNASPINGNITGLMIWSGIALTQAQLQYQMFHLAPIFTQNLYGYWPLFSPADLKDLGGGKHNLTAGATPTAADGGPPASW